ncbi:MAG: hypothetical protein ACREI7_12700, partial [Myxococcota bacterium]
MGNRGTGRKRDRKYSGNCSLGNGAVPSTVKGMTARLRPLPGRAPGGPTANQSTPANSTVTTAAVAKRGHGR